MDEILRFVKERNEALFSLDRKRIEAFAAKNGTPYPPDASDVIFWASVYKAICNIRNAPEDVVFTAREWLAAHNMREQIIL